MRNQFSSQTRDQGHMSRKPLSTRNLPMRRRYFMLAILASPSPVLAFAGKPTGYVFTSFDVPGATSTRGFDINHAATIVGDFVDTIGVSHGFFWSGGGFTRSIYRARPRRASGGSTMLAGVGRYDDPSGPRSRLRPQRRQLQPRRRLRCHHHRDQGDQPRRKHRRVLH